MTDREKLIDLIINAKRTDPETGSFTEYLADFLLGYGVKLPDDRPVSREQVEKVWRGCEKCNGAGEYSRYAENLAKILLAKYCPHCGRPLTDEAVDMMLERWKEAVEGV